MTAQQPPGSAQARMQVFYMTPTGKTRPLYLYPHQTIAEMKLAIEAQEREPLMAFPRKHQLYFAYKQLQNHMTLADYDIVNGSMYTGSKINAD
jgi:hypothetical protein